MTEKRYLSVDYDEEYYIFDSTKISEEEVLEKAEYSYDVFGESLSPQEHLDLLNENDGLKQELNDCKDANVRCCNEYSYFHKQMMKLEKENDELKQQLNDMIALYELDEVLE